MEPNMIVDVFRNGMLTAVILISSVVLPSLFIGLVIAMFQAATQINEVSLNFIPKLLITMTLIMVGMPWFLNTLVDFAKSIFNQIPYMVG